MSCSTAVHGLLSTHGVSVDCTQEFILTITGKVTIATLLDAPFCFAAAFEVSLLVAPVACSLVSWVLLSAWGGDFPHLLHFCGLGANPVVLLVCL